MEPASGPNAASGEKHHRISGYEILAKIGEGGMGVVFKAKQLSLDRVVALKVLSPRLAADEKLIEQFLREAKVIARLSHPHIVRIYEVDRSKGGIHYYAMEYVDGESAGRLLKSRGKLPIDEAVRIASQIARALAHAHEHGLVHRDVKPDNILLAADGTAKLADLGLARSFQGEHPAQSTTGSIVGTPYYMAPEQAEGREVDARCDLYALGATLYHFVVGAPPFVADSAIGVITKHLTEARPDPRRLNPEVPATLANIIAKLLRIDPKERYANARSVVEDLERVLARRAPVHAGAETPPLARNLARPAVAGALVGLLLVGLGGLLVHRSRRTRAENEAARLLAEAREAFAKGQQAGSPAQRRIEELSACLSILDDLARTHPGTDAARKAALERGDIAQALAIQQLSAARQAESDLDALLAQPPHRRDFPLETLRSIEEGFARLAAMSDDQRLSDEARTLARKAQLDFRQRIIGYYNDKKSVADARGELARRRGEKEWREAFERLHALLPLDSQAARLVQRELEWRPPRRPR